MWKIKPGQEISDGQCLSPNCDIGLGSMWLGGVHGIPSCYGEKSCEVMSTSIKYVEYTDRTQNCRQTMFEPKL